jgi:oligopeptide transport system ATP-binding protein
LDPILEVKNLTTTFHTSNGKVQAVRDVSFSLAEKEILGLVGESGSGKSVTSLSLIRLLAPTAEISAKEILYKGEDISRLTKKRMRRVRGKEIAMIFQDPMTSLNPLMTIGNQVAEMIRQHSRLSASKVKRRVLSLLEKVHIPEAEKRYSQYPHELSGGMRQRVMIALALAMQPGILIADEPTTALDVTIQDQVLKVIRELQDEFGTSIIFITHDLAVVAELCDRVLVMYGGQIMEDAPIDALFERPLHPYTVGLMASIPSIEQDRETKLKPIPGSPPDMLNPPAGCPFAPRCSEIRQICLDSPPPFVELEENRHSRCWLLTKEAKDLDHPFREYTDRLYKEAP